jgi:hypothetical protein
MLSNVAFWHLQLLGMSNHSIASFVVASWLLFIFVGDLYAAVRATAGQAAAESIAQEAMAGEEKVMGSDLGRGSESRAGHVSRLHLTGSSAA